MYIGFFLSTEYMAKKALTKTDIKNIENFYIKKVEQFNKFTLEELKVLYNKGRLSATEQRALFDVVNTKLQQRKEETIAVKLLNKLKKNQMKLAALLMIIAALSLLHSMRK